jgi:hypothetical protein
MICGTALRSIGAAGGAGGHVRVAVSACGLFTARGAGWPNPDEVYRMRIKSIEHVQLAMPPGRDADARKFYAELLGIP